VTSTRRAPAPPPPSCWPCWRRTPLLAAPVPAPAPPLTKTAADALAAASGALARPRPDVAASVEVAGYGGVPRNSGGRCPLSLDAEELHRPVPAARARARRPPATESPRRTTPGGRPARGPLVARRRGDPFLTGAQLAALRRRCVAARHHRRRGPPARRQPLRRAAQRRRLAALLRARRVRAAVGDGARPQPVAPRPGVPRRPRPARGRPLPRPARGRRVGVTGAVRRAPRPAEAVPSRCTSRRRCPCS
jgi:hypothetical protein